MDLRKTVCRWNYITASPGKNQYQKQWPSQKYETKNKLRNT